LGLIKAPPAADNGRGEADCDEKKWMSRRGCLYKKSKRSNLLPCGEEYCSAKSKALKHVWQSEMSWGEPELKGEGEGNY